MVIQELILEKEKKKNEIQITVYSKTWPFVLMWMENLSGNGAF